MRPLLSIVIPTKDRYNYLIQLVELIQSFNSKDIETVIQDNTKDNSEIVEYLRQKNYKGLKYSHESEQLTICENSDKAILNSVGEFVCYLGDDDGTTAEILDVIHWLKKKGIDAAITAHTYYMWPDAYDGGKALLKYPKKMAGDYSILETKEILDKCLKDGLTWRDGLPGVYHGIVKRELLDNIYKKCGTFFPGPSPDIANCIAVCLSSDKYVFVDRAIIINGAGKNHGGGSYRKDISLRKLPFLPDNIMEAWEPQIPLAWTATTIWCEASVKALRAMGRIDLISKVNFYYMYATFASLYFSNISLVFAIKPNLFKLSRELILRFCAILSKRLRYVLAPKTTSCFGINNIQEASIHLANLK